MPQPKRFTDEELRARHNARSRARYQKKRVEIAAYHAELYQKQKAADPGFMRKNSERAKARRDANLDHAKAIAKKSRQKHSERRQAEARAWFAENPEKRRAYEANRRAKKRERGGSLSPEIAGKLFVLQRGKCACCRTALKDVKQHLDHIVPLALGGLNSDENMQILCQPCNQTKHAKHPVDFMQSRGYLL